MDKEYLHQIKSFFHNNRRMPSYGEILNLLGFKSKESVTKLINRLVNAGCILKDKTGKLIPHQSFNGIPHLGTVVAGWPSPAEEELQDVMSLDDYLISNKEATFRLKVSGDSMIGEGMKDGDMVFVQRGLQPRNDDVVVAQVDGKWTLKYFKKEKNKVWLESANPKYKPIYPKEELIIAAVVIGLVRKYRA